jgi:4-aminobutyrate aminotransferase/(S)-3-amino-2-methylpropionate transaminase
MTRTPADRVRTRNPVVAAALAVLDKIEREDLLSAAARTGAIVETRFREMQEKHAIVGDVRGRGAMWALEMVADRGTKEPLPADRMGAIARTALANGVVVLTAGTYSNVVRLLPPINIDEALLEDGLSVLEEAVGTA